MSSLQTADSIKDAQLRNWVYRQRKEHRQNKLSSWKKQKLDALPFWDFDPRKTKGMHGRAWAKQLGILPNDHRGLQWLEQLLTNYTKGKDFRKVKSYRTLCEFVIGSMKVTDIHPKECTRDKPVSDIRHTISYMLTPDTEDVQTPSPTKRMMEHDQAHHYTVYFGPESFPDGFFDCALQHLPEWLIHYNNHQITLTKDELVQKISDTVPFFDPFPVSVLGTNLAKGVAPITDLAHSTPRRANLSDRVHPDKYKTQFHCHVFTGYTYTLSFCPDFLYYGRPIDPGFAELKVKLWKMVKPHLSPISQLCPPNGCQLLAYFREFKGRINAHRDMNPNMVVSPEINSQIIGSSVLVVSFLAKQYFHLCQQKKSTMSNGKPTYNYPSLDSFLTEHCSVYILDPRDDVRWHHKTEFPPGEKGMVRISLTFRWLGRRQEFLCQDYAFQRKGSSAVGRPRDIIKKMSPKKQSHYLQTIMEMKEEKKLAERATALAAKRVARRKTGEGSDDDPEDNDDESIMSRENSNGEETPEEDAATALIQLSTHSNNVTTKSGRVSKAKARFDEITYAKIQR